MLTGFRIKGLFHIVLLIALLLSTVPISAQDPPPDEQPLVSFDVRYSGRTYDSATNRTTFTYIVSGTGSAPDLSHFDIGLPVCSPQLLVVGTSPAEAVRFGVDPTTGVDGIKWDLPLQTTETRTYSITFEGNVAEGGVPVAVKGDTAEVGTIKGPSCIVTSINVEKFLSVDGTNWLDPAGAPGYELAPDSQVWFRFIVTNTGNTDLTAITLSDSVYDASGCTVSGTLAPATSFDCVIGPFPVIDGEHMNIATVSGAYNNLTVMASDSAHYFSGNFPQIQIEKAISTDGGTTWRDSAQVRPGDNVSFRFQVTNVGNVELSSLALTDSAFDTSSCTLPVTLLPDAGFECVIGPFPAGEVAHTNTATVTAAFQGQTVTDTDTASYEPRAEPDDTDVTIIIEGPVTSINTNIVTIFDMDIEIAPNDPSLTWLQVGDTVRVEGGVRGTGNTIVIVAVNVVVVDVDIVIVQPNAPPRGPIYVPEGCKITGIGNNNPHLKCSYRSSRGSGSRRSS